MLVARPTQTEGSQPRKHPMVNIGGTLQDNLFFVPPAQFLQKLREQRVRQAHQDTEATPP
jgi:hypothetical protein